THYSPALPKAEAASVERPVDRLRPQARSILPRRRFDRRTRISPSRAGAHICSGALPDGFIHAAWTVWVIASATPASPPACKPIWCGAPQSIRRSKIIGAIRRAICHLFNLGLVEANGGLRAPHVLPRIERGRFERPTIGWACGVTGEVVRDTVQRVLVGRPGQTGTGAIPKDAIAELVSARGIPDLLDSIKINHVSGGQSVIGLK